MNAINETLSDSSTMRAAPSQQQQSAATSSTPDLQSPTSADPQQDTTSSYSSGDLEVQQATEIMSTGAPSLPATSVTGTGENIVLSSLTDLDPACGAISVVGLDLSALGQMMIIMDNVALYCAHRVFDLRLLCSSSLGQHDKQ